MLPQRSCFPEIFLPSGHRNTIHRRNDTHLIIAVPFSPGDYQAPERQPAGVLFICLDNHFLKQCLSVLSLYAPDRGSCDDRTICARAIPEIIIRAAQIQFSFLGLICIKSRKEYFIILTTVYFVLCRLKRLTGTMTKNIKLGVFDCTMIVVSLVIGMGIFRTPANVAKHVPDSFTFFFTWIAGGLVALCGALTYAEIGSRLPVTGGYYKVFSYGYHASVAFAINCIILISNAASLAGVTLIGSEYISSVLFPSIGDARALQVREIAVSIFSIVLFYGVNLLSV